jgi:pilus assembly protein Flp/PilA
MLKVLKRLVKEEQGQGMAEYGLILALVAVVVIGALVLFGDAIKSKFEDVTGGLNEPPAPDEVESGT